MTMRPIFATVAIAATIAAALAITTPAFSRGGAGGPGGGEQLRAAGQLARRRHTAGLEPRSENGLARRNQAARAEQTLTGKTRRAPTLSRAAGEGSVLFWGRVGGRDRRIPMQARAPVAHLSANSRA